MTHDLPAGTYAPDSTSAAQRPAAKSAGRGPDTPDTRVPERRVRIGSPLTLLAVVPGLLGFEPAHSIVVIGTGRPHAEVRVTLRFDLPDPADSQAAVALAGHAVDVLAAQRITTAAAVGYGADGVVSPVVRALRSRAAAAGITMIELLRAEDSRYWSYVCTNPTCCPPQGTPFDVADHPAARALTGGGHRVLTSRDELAATIASAGGESAVAMGRATRQAEKQIARCVGRMTRAGHRITRRPLLAAVGLVMVGEAIRRYRAGDTISTELAAWLTIALREVRVRDDAWARMLPAHRGEHRRLWTDLTRLARPGYVSAPASLLAFVAWQSGDGALANVALDRALADNRRYSMALLLRRALDSGAPPSMARLPMTPEEVAASYDAQDAEGDAAATAARTGAAGEAGRM